MGLFYRIVSGSILLASYLPSFAQGPGDNVFAGLQVHTINLQFPQARYWDSLTIYYSQGNEQYIPATAIVNGVTIDSIGVRLKGNSSYSHPNNKKSFRLSFDEYREEQRWDGLKGVHINNCWGDPTFMREKMYLDFCRDAGVAAPRANYVQVFVNDTLFAFYSLVEHVDKRFLGSRYGNNDGDLFKAVDAFGTGIVSDFRWYGATQSTYHNRYEMKTEESTTAWTNLVEFLDSLNNNPNAVPVLPDMANLPAFYRAIATDNLFANLDSYINAGRNFYFYFQPTTHKVEWIVWDTGLSFGSYTGGVQNLENLSITYVSSATNRPLMGKIVNTPALRTAYLQSYCNAFTRYFSPARLFPLIDSIASTIRPYVYADPKKMYTNQQFETNIVSDINASGGGGQRKPGLKSFINLRQTSVQAQLMSLGVTCVTTVSPGDVVINEFMASNSSIPDPAGELDDWIEFYNTTSQPVDLGGMYLSDDFAAPTKWQFPPNTTINPDGYLIVWADADTGQAGLHAAFALSANGEQILLSDNALGLLDSVSFGPQIVDMSMARIPNGTGPFVQGLPTFNANNDSGTGGPTPELTTLVLPQVIQGINGTNANRIPYAYRARITDLLANAEYRYINQVVTSADAPTTNGAGNCIFVPPTGNFVRTTSPGLVNTGTYGTFTTDATGTYDGWFVTEPSGNARFVPGSHIFMRVILNDGAGGTTVATRLTTTDSVRVVKLDPAVSDSTGTGLRGNSSASPGDFVLAYDNAYDNADGTSRPASGTFVENDGTNNSTGNNYAAFYANNVNTIDGAFGMVLPNVLPGGVQRVERRSRSTGSVVAYALDADGVWPSGANTVNPSGGTTEIVLTADDVNQLTTDVNFLEDVPRQFALAQNYPNPFNPSTTIVYRVGSRESVSLKIYDVLGREVVTLVNGKKDPGEHTVEWNAENIPSGVYYYRLMAADRVETRKAVLLK
jgi:hypothetical protein